jgi:hypothetical protein
VYSFLFLMNYSISTWTRHTKGLTCRLKGQFSFLICIFIVGCLHGMAMHSFRDDWLLDPIRHLRFVSAYIDRSVHPSWSIDELWSMWWIKHAFIVAAVDEGSMWLAPLFHQYAWSACMLPLSKKQLRVSSDVFLKAPLQRDLRHVGYFTAFSRAS